MKTALRHRRTTERQPAHHHARKSSASPSGDSPAPLGRLPNRRGHSLSPPLSCQAPEELRAPVDADGPNLEGHPDEDRLEDGGGRSGRGVAPQLEASQRETTSRAVNCR